MDLTNKTSTAPVSWCVSREPVVMEITSRVVTAVRIRPLSSSEDGYKNKIVTYVGGNPGQVILLDPCYYEKTSTPEKRDRDRRISERSFQFDYSFNSLNLSDEGNDSTQAGIYEKIGIPLIENVFDGYNCSLFAYGQTGSGKTYTMVGILDDSEEEGLIPRISRDLILQSLSKKNTRDVVTNDLIVDIKLQVSFFEIYNERVYDLLSSSDNIAPCRVREHPETGAFIEGLTYRTVGSYEAVSLSLYEGFRRRITGETLMNANSSRSHAVFTIYMTQTRSSSSVSLPSQGATINSPRCKRSQSLSESTPSSPSSPASSSPSSSPAPSPSASSRRSLVDPSLNTFSRISKISLVDLAGSERLDATRSKGMRMKEGTMINLSLSTLGDVIKALSCAQKESATMSSSLKHVPYRNSALTWVLKDCIGGNSRTTIMATISPHAPHYAESLNTIRFITKAKLIVNKVRVNEKRTDDTSGSSGASEEVVKEMGVKLQVFEKRISELEQIIRKHGLSSEMLESLFPDEERTEWSGEGDGEREGEGNENDLESPVGVGEGEGDGEEAMATDVERVNNSLSDDEEGLNQILPLDDLVVQQLISANLKIAELMTVLQNTEHENIRLKKRVRHLESLAEMILAPTE